MDKVELPTQGFLLPDLCSGPATLFLILVAVLLALTLVLFSHGWFAFNWIAFGHTAVFVLGTMMSSATMLCLLRRRIASWSLFAGASCAYALILAVCLIGSIGYQGYFQWLDVDVSTGVDLRLLGRDVMIAALLGGAALRYFHLQSELLKRQRSELSSRIAALQARIRPHFLFNSMNIIASLIAVDPESAERAVEDLSELFRASLREDAATVPLDEELDWCNRYLRLEKLRLGERLQVHRSGEGATDAWKIPPLTIQPLLENAVYHGIQPRPDGGEIRLRIDCGIQSLRIRIDNPLPDSAIPLPGSGMALGNIRDRLAGLYGSRARLDAGIESGQFVAYLEIQRSVSGVDPA